MFINIDTCEIRSNFMDVSASYDLDEKGQGKVSWGLMGSIQEIPSDYETSFIICYSQNGIKEVRDLRVSSFPFLINLIKKIIQGN